MVELGGGEEKRTLSRWEGVGRGSKGRCCCGDGVRGECEEGGEEGGESEVHCIELRGPRGLSD